MRRAPWAVLGRTWAMGEYIIFKLKAFTGADPVAHRCLQESGQPRLVDGSPISYCSTDIRVTQSESKTEEPTNAVRAHRLESHRREFN
jgi:hypothetical protein